MDRRSFLVGVAPGLVGALAGAYELGTHIAANATYSSSAPALVRSPIRFDATAYGAGAKIGADNTVALKQAISDARAQGRDLVLEAAPYIIGSLIVPGSAPLYMHGRGGGLTSLKIERGQVPRSGWGLILANMVDGVVADLAIDLDDPSFVRDNVGVVGGFLMSGCHGTSVDILVVGKYQIGMSQLNCIAPTLEGKIVFTGALPPLFAGETAPAYQKRTGRIPYGIAVLGQGTDHRSALYKGIVIEGRPASGIYSGGGIGSSIINCRCTDGCMTGSAFQLVSTSDGRIIGNQVKNNGADGINATDSSRIIIEQNSVLCDDSNGFDEGISTSYTKEEKFTGVIIRSNNLNNIFKVGISLGAGAQNCLVDGNILENCGVRGVAVYGSDPGAWAPICCENANPGAGTPGNVNPAQNTGNLITDNIIFSTSGSVPVGIAELAAANGRIGQNFYTDNVVSGRIQKAVQLEPTGRSLRRDIKPTTVNLPVFEILHGREARINEARAHFNYRHDFDRIYFDIRIVETSSLSLNERYVLLPSDASIVEEAVIVFGSITIEDEMSSVTAKISHREDKFTMVSFAPVINQAMIGKTATVEFSGSYAILGGS